MLSLAYGIHSAYNQERAGILIGPVIATYQFALGKRITMGVEAGYAFYKTDPFDFTYTNRNGDRVNVTSEVIRYYRFIGGFRTDFHYLKKKRVDLYSGLRLNVGPIIEKYSVATLFDNVIFDLNFGLNVLGCRYVLTPHVSVYGEVGLGSTGNGTLGISTNLGRPEKKALIKQPNEGKKGP